MSLLPTLELGVVHYGLQHCIQMVTARWLPAGELDYVCAARFMSDMELCVLEIPGEGKQTKDAEICTLRELFQDMEETLGEFTLNAHSLEKPTAAPTQEQVGGEEWLVTPTTTLHQFQYACLDPGVTKWTSMASAFPDSAARQEFALNYALLGRLLPACSVHCVWEVPRASMVCCACSPLRC